MKKVYLKEPRYEELIYRKNLLADEKTMEYNWRYGGTIDFPESKWDAWYTKWIKNKDPKYFYRYIYDNRTNAPVGEVAYRNEEDNFVYLSIIIHYNERKNKYGEEALIKLIKEAFNSGYDEVRDLIDIDSLGAHYLFEKVGFTYFGDIEFSRDYRLKKEDFEKPSK